MRFRSCYIPTLKETPADAAKTGKTGKPGK